MKHEHLLMNSEPLRVIACLCAGLALVCSSIALVSGEAKLGIPAMGLAAGCFVLLPVCRRGEQVYLLDPVILFALATLIGTVARSIYFITSRVESLEQLIDGVPDSIILVNSLASLVGFAAVALGYRAAAGRRSPSFPRWLVNRRFDQRRLTLAASSTLAFSVVGLAAFVSQAGVELSDLASLSNKRAVQVGGEFTALTHVRLLASSSQYALYLLVLYWCPRWAYRPFWLPALLLAAGGVALVLPFLSSSRAGVLFVLLNSLLAVALRRPIPRRALGLAAVCVLGVAVGMGALRDQAQGRATEVGSLAESIFSPVEATVGSGNYVDFVVPSVVIDRVPERMPHLHGSSYVAWLATPIPRTLWPGKPNVSLGVQVRRDVYLLPTQGQGIPPGLFGEAYLNFGLVGIPLIGFLFGVTLRVLRSLLVPRVHLYDFYAIAAVAVLIRLSFSLPSVNVSLGIAQAGIEFVTLTILWVAVSTNRSVEGGGAGVRL